MERISYGGTFLYKVVFPAFWFGLLTLLMAMGVFTAGRKQPIFIIQPLLMVVFGYFLFRKLVWTLADEVQDGGDYLLVRKGSIEQRIPMTNIINVSMSQFTNPKRLTLRLRNPCELGDEIAFIPQVPVFQWNPFARNAVVEDLIRRVDQARQEAGK
jgi:hypothetical protein